jgi:hypothetical protein
MGKVVNFPGKLREGRVRNVLKFFKWNSGTNLGFFQTVFVLFGLVLGLFSGGAYSSNLLAQLGASIVDVVIFVTVFGYLGMLIDKTIRLIRSAIS